MRKVIFDLRTITPVFMAGAEQGKAELRAPSFRGAMRYWLRAVVGGVVGSTSEALKKVADFEKSVFGTADSGSPIQVRIHYDLEKKVTTGLEEPQTLVGKIYLWWSVIAARRRPALSTQPQQTFQVTLAVRYLDPAKEKEVLERAVSAFWLLTHLGGIGTRSRRCAGSLAVAKPDEAWGFPFGTPPSIKQLQEQLEKGIRKSKALYEDKQKIFESEPSFDILHAESCSIWILSNDGKPWSDVDQALNDIGSKLQQYRSSISYRNNLKVFGIPIMFKNNIGKLQRHKIWKTDGNELNRMASPLHLRLAELQAEDSKQYVGIATLFKTKWKHLSKRDAPQYTLIKKWIEEKFPGDGALEVEL